jgi:translation elongation factor EF-1beta
MEVPMTDMYPVVDLSSPAVDAGVLYESGVKVDPEAIARELKEIAEAVAPIIGTQQHDNGFGLQSVAITLTVGAEGGVAFVAKGSAEASITLTLGRMG